MSCLLPPDPLPRCLPARASTQRSPSAIGAVSRAFPAAIVTDVTGDTSVNVDMGGDEATAIDFTPPFRRVWIVPALEEKLGCKLPDVNDPGGARSADAVTAHTTSRLTAASA